jgi:ketosteroid isomerase-like protein
MVSTKSFSEGDLKGILSDYPPDAVMFTPDGPLRGPDEMRPLFRALIAEFGKPGGAFTLKRQSITFVVRDGKIAAQSFTGKIRPKG